MSKADKDRAIIDRYEELYFRRNNETVTVKSTGSGWYTLLHEGGSLINTFKRHRLSEIATMADRLEIMVAELEAAATREGYVVVVIPPRSAAYRNITNRYLTEDGWSHDKADPSVKVFKSSTDADERAHELNSAFPYNYAIIEPF